MADDKTATPPAPAGPPGKVVPINEIVRQTLAKGGFIKPDGKYDFDAIKAEIARLKKAGTWNPSPSRPATAAELASRFAGVKPNIPPPPEKT